MATGVLLTPPIIQFFSNAGLVAANGSILTQVGGINTATYQDVNLTTPLPNPIPLNSRGEISTAAGASSQCFLTPNTVYVVTFFDGPNATGNQIWQGTYVNGVQVSLTQASVGAALWPRSAAEIAAGVTPTALNWYYGWVQRYGAVGDGATDDSTAFANAALVCGTYPMTIPYTSTGYKVTTPFVLPANASMIGLGRPQLFATVNGTHICSATGVTGSISIQGIRFLGTSASTVPLSGFGGFVAGNTGLVTVTTCSNVRITDCDFSTFYNGLCVQGSTRAWIQRNKVDTFLTTGISCPSTTEFEVEFNDISNCTQAGGVVAYGVQCTGNQAGGSTAQFNSVSFNRIEGVPSWDAIGTHDIDGLRIIGNDCRNVRHGIDVGHLVNTNVVQNITVANNYVEGPTSDTWGGSAAEIAGIIISGFDATHRVSGATITGNTVRNYFNVSGMVGGGNGAGCIAVNNVDDANICGNSITGGGTQTIAAASGIYCSGTCNRLTINGNNIQGGSYVRGGIRLSTVTSDTTVISGNSGVQTTTGNNHILITSSTITNLSVGVNPSNSTAPYSETSNTIGSYSAGGVLNTFTGTLTGCMTSPTPAVSYSIAGDTVTLNFPATTATSNANSCTITGLPAALQPRTLTTNVEALLEDNTAAIYNGTAKIAPGSGTITFLLGNSATGFTGSGTKGILACSISYPLS